MYGQVCIMPPGFCRLARGYQRTALHPLTEGFEDTVGSPSSDYNPFWHIGHVAPFGGCLTAPQRRLKPGHTFGKVGCLRSSLSLSSLKLVCIQFGFVLFPSIRGIPFASFSLHGREQGQIVRIGSFSA